MLSYRKLAMRVLGRPLNTGGGIDSPRPASQRAAALVLTAALLTGAAFPAFADTYYIEDGDITISAGTQAGTNKVEQTGKETVENDRDTIVTNRKEDTASSHTVTINAGNDKVEVTLDNVNIKADSGSALISKGDVTLTLKGDNHLTGGNGGSSSYGGDGITSSGSLTISGGTVTATGGDSTSSVGSGGSGIYSVSGDVTISGGTVNANGGDGKNGSGGGSGIDSSGGVTVSGGTVTANGGDGGSGSGSHGGNGIYSSSGVAISGGAVTANGGDSKDGDGGNGIYSSGGVTISSGSTVTANGGNGEDGSGGRGITSNGGVTVSGGTVNAKGGSGKNGNGGDGILSFNPVAISGGTVKSNGGSGNLSGGNGIISYDIDLSGSLELTAKAGSPNGKALSRVGSELDLNTIKDKLDPGAKVTATDADGKVIQQVSIPRPVEPEEPSSSSDGGSATPSAPASPLPGLTVTDKDGQRISYTSIRGNNVLSLSVGRFTASLHASLSTLRQLRAEGIDTITFQTILCSTTLSVDELLAMGGEDAEVVLTHHIRSSTLTVGGKAV